MSSDVGSSYDAQLNPQPPPPDDPHDGPLLEEPVEAAKVESRRVVLSLPQLGQATELSELPDSSSNFVSHSVHLYSNNGIVYLFSSCRDIPAPNTTPIDDVSQGLHISCQVDPNWV